jgi:hypothetical protein
MIAQACGPAAVTVSPVAPSTMIAPVATRQTTHARRTEDAPTQLRGPPAPLQTPASPVATVGGTSAAAGGASGGRDCAIQVDAVVLELPDGAPAVATDLCPPAPPATAGTGARAPPLA